MIKNKRKKIKEQKISNLITGVTGYYTMLKAAEYDSVMSISNKIRVSLFEKHPADPVLNHDDFSKKPDVKPFFETEPLKIDVFNCIDTPVFEYRNKKMRVYISIDKFPNENLKMFFEVFVSMIIWNLKNSDPLAIQIINKIGEC